MSYDAAMLSACITEIRQVCLGCKVEKVLMPVPDEIILQMRTRQGTARLSLLFGTHPRIQLTSRNPENPAKPPMLCMLLRKHLQGANLCDIQQKNFDRVVVLTFDARDDMGYPTKKKLVCELMGSYSNLIFTDETDKILALLRPGDFASTSRTLLCGATYELPPKQNKNNPLTTTREEFDVTLEALTEEMTVVQFFSTKYFGFSRLLCQEISYQATKDTESVLNNANRDAVWNAFCDRVNGLMKEEYTPSVVFRNGVPEDFSPFAVTHRESKVYETPSNMLDDFFREKEQANFIHQKASDIQNLLHRTVNRIQRKLKLQEKELKESEKGADYKALGDLITANLYLLKPGMDKVVLTDYSKTDEKGDYATVELELNARYTPGQNAQIYYKKYAKAKKAGEILTEQMEKGQRELEYLETVADALSRATSVATLDEIRLELQEGGYTARMNTKKKVSPKKAKPDIASTKSPNGYTVMWGGNNLQNEYLTHKLAGKNDYWFHAKNRPGSHVILFCNGEEPAPEDFTFAAEIAGRNSKNGGGASVEVDYTKVKNLKKPPDANPGFVIYHTNYSCVVNLK